MRLLPALLLTCCGLGLAAADAPAANRLWLTYGDYMFGFQCLPGMTQALLEAGEPKAPPITRLGLGIGAHGSTVEIWKSGAVAWITGEGKAATTNWRDNHGSQKVAATLEGRQADLVLVQLDLSYITGREAEKMKAETDTAVAGYVAAATKANAKLVFYVLPGSQHTTHKRGGKEKDAPLVPKTEADHQPQLVALEAEAARLTKAHNAVLAPTFRAFAALRAAHPEIDLHAPTRGDDTHLSAKDAALCALVIARTFLGESFVPPATPEPLLAIQNKPITAENAKRKSKGESEQPLSTIDEAIWHAMLAATSAAVTSP
jgi:hypothetical protein